MTKPHQEYEFGTFDERLAHISALLEIEPFPFVLDKPNEPKLCDDALEWLKANGINMDWLFCGSPSVILKQYADQKKRNVEYVELMGQMKPEVVAALRLALEAVVEEKLPLKEVMAQLHRVVAEGKTYRTPRSPQSI